MSRAVFLFATLLLAACTTAPPPTTAARPVVSGLQLIPAPASLVIRPGAAFELTRATAIVVDGTSPEATAIAQGLGTLLRPSTGFPLAVTASDTAANKIQLRLAADRTSLGEEGYELTAAANSVTLVANRPAGLFRGVQTLRQLLPADVESQMGAGRAEWTIPAVAIVDQPRFPWRGAMLDVARHFFTVREVEQYIDLLALYKMNVLHLHLSDDQGWRIVINSRPKLASIGGSTQVGGGPGGFYTQQDYQTIVRYAQERYITVVPEIDMPAHTNAAIVAYPEVGCSVRPTQLYTETDVGWSALCVDKEATYALVEDIVREISAITPGPYFHIGGDEVEALTHEQYVRFIERVQTIVNRHGKKMVGWEEITKAKLDPGTVAQQWKSDSVTAALQYGSKLIMSPAKKVYLDMKYTPVTELGLHWAAFVEVRDAYDWDPALYMTGVNEASIVGVEAPLWSETVRNISAVEYMAMPRLPAVAEVGWTPQRLRDWENFRVRVAMHAPRWNYLGVNYYRSPQIPW
ncbi:MAG: beta-N-acetylhexosaminidase [Gemmatimonadota bacterium]|nr:beta-N-acetylhexosaminidase [Gemmatimonadota bacterium]